MGKAWGVYVRFGKISLTKRFDSLRQAIDRYDRLTRRRKKPDLWIALIPLSGEKR